MLDRSGHTVAVIDQSSDSFQRLSPEFGGETIVGNGVDEDVMMRAGIKDADAFIAVTNGDNRNIMASQIAKEIFRVKRLCAVSTTLSVSKRTTNWAWIQCALQL